MAESQGQSQEPGQNGKTLFNKLRDVYQKHRKLSWASLALIIVTIIGMSWYNSLPEPETIKVYLDEPGLTDLNVEKPVPDPLIVSFGDSVAQLQDIGKPVTHGVTLSPAIEGQWLWQDDRHLVFTPQNDWGVKQTYTVSLDKTLFPERLRLDQYQLSFITAKFTGQLVDTEFYQDPENPRIKKLVSTVRFSHRVDQEDFMDRVEIIMKPVDQREKNDGHEVPLDITFNKVGNEAYIHSKPVDIPLKAQNMILTVDDDARSKDNGVKLDLKLSHSVSVPGMYSYFRIEEADITLVRNDHNDPEQVLVIETTDGVKADILQNSLEVYLLPEDRPATKTESLVKHYHWRNREEIGPEILGASMRLQLDPIPAEHDTSSQHSFRLNIPPRRSIFVRIKKGIESTGGYILATTFEETAMAPDYPREIEIMGKGALLSLAGDNKLSIVSRGNKGLSYEVGYVLPSQVQHLITQTNGDFANPGFVNYYFDENNITQRFEHKQRLPDVEPGHSQFTSFDFSEYLDQQAAGKRSGIFLLKINGWDPDRKYNTGITTKRLILVTDLGLVVKQNADRSRDVFVMSLRSGQPVAGADVKVLGKNGLPVFNRSSDSDGRVSIPNLHKLTREKMPTAILASYSNNISFIPYDQADRKLDLSRFDIGGIRQHGKSDTLSAYLFSDRGIYRPGDTFNVGMIIKSSSWQRDLGGIPLQTVITDPRGLVIKESTLALSSTGFESLSYTTRDSSPTGEYEIKLYLMKDKRRHTLLGSTSIKVEEFLPDRMKIAARFSNERALGWVHPKDLSARVNLKNLYGTPATERRITSSMTLSPYNPVFRKFSDFRFHDPLKAEKGFTERLPELETNEEGEVEIPLNLERFSSTSYSVALQVNGFEADGGRSVSTARSILVSPREYLVGYKSDGKLSYVSKNSERSVHLIAINPALEQTQADKLKIELIEQRYVSALIKQDNGTYRYQSVRKEKKLKESDLRIPAKGMNYALPTGEPGDYLLVIRDAGGTELNRLSFSVAGEANLGRNLEKNAELQIKLDRQDYEPGDEIQVNIRAPYVGAGLITIERDKVYKYKWFRTTSTSSIQTITLPDGIEGNAYINVSFVREPGSQEIFMSPLSYGIAPFTISRDARRNQVALKVPYLLRPGETVDIQYQVQHPGKIVVFAVDEGILQVANYQTPQPLKHFFRKQALEVDTLQILDMLLPEYSVVREVSAAGGGMADDAISSNLNPFKRRTHKPVAYWSGIIDADPQGGHLSYTVPDHFNGTLRFMAVVVSPGSLGVTQEKSLARGHFVLSPNVPTFVAPKDQFDISLNVANNVEGSGKGAKVKVQLKTSDHLKIVESASQELTIDEGREKTVRFKLTASKDKLGSANLSFVASTGGKQSTASIDLSVRPPIPYMVDVMGGYVQDDDVTLTLKRNMYPEFRTRDLDVSTVPLGLSRGMLTYLEKYPHLCTEQLVSRVFPMVALKNQPELGYEFDKAQSSVDRVVDILRSRQNDEGAFGFWAANSHVSPTQSLYALHFLHQAKLDGFAIPDSMIERGLEYAKQIAQQDIDNLGDARERAYAIYLLTDNGVVTTRYLNDMLEKMNRFYQDKWKQEISRAYMAASYRLLQLDEQAVKLINDMKFGGTIEIDYDSFYDDLSRNAQLLYVLSKHFPERVSRISGKDLESIVVPVNNGYFNTLSSSYSILALSAYAQRAGTAADLKMEISGIDSKKQKSELKLPQGKLFPTLALAETFKQVSLDNQSPQPVFYQVTEAGFDQQVPKEKLEQGLEIHREYQDTDGKTITQVKMGEEIDVHLQLRSIDDVTHYNVAIVDLLPGGFELVRDASRQQDAPWRADYMDLREDRIVLYGTVTKKAQEFVYRIKATNRGTFAVAPPYAEDMYNRKVRYRGLGSQIEVE